MMKIASFLLFSLILASCGSNNSVHNEKNQNATKDSIPSSASTSSANSGDKGTGINDTSQEKEKIETAIPPNNDTIFIVRELTKDMYHAIYIEKQKNTQRFKWLTNFSFDNNDSEGYKYGKEYQKEKHPKAYKTKVNTFYLPKNWVPLHQYENQFYTYAPSDWGNTGQRILNDLEFIQMYMDGPNPNPIESTKKINSHHFEFTLFNENILRVYLYDSKRQIYIFEIDGGSYGSDYRFYTPATNAGKFDMIVNYCETQKQMEYRFEEVNFEALIKHIK